MAAAHGDRDDRSRAVAVRGGVGRRDDRRHASAAASSTERTSSASPPASARYSLTIPSTASADAVDPTMSAHHASVGAHVWVSATTVSAARAHRWGTQSVASGGGTPNGFRTRSASELATRPRS